MDSLTYLYNRNSAGLLNNRLNYVKDLAGVTEGTDLSSAQSLNNYQYDAIGNLTSDASEGITDITWSVYGKVLSVLNSSNSKADISFVYDASGNRVKKVSTIPAGTTVTTYYIRDASGNIMATYEQQNSTTTLQYSLYGSSRLGVLTGSTVTNGVYLRKPTLRSYELTNHLGNVLATISGIKTGTDADADQDADYYSPNTLAAQEYYAFGFTMPGRNFGVGYRYGFNGKESDKDWSLGAGVTYDYGFRIYDARLGKFLSVDPLSPDYSFYSPYQFAGNSPIYNLDLDGLEDWSYINNLVRRGSNYIVKKTSDYVLDQVDRVSTNIYNNAKKYINNKINEYTPTAGALNGKVSGTVGGFKATLKVGGTGNASKQYTGGINFDIKAAVGDPSAASKNLVTSKIPNLGVTAGVEAEALFGQENSYLELKDQGPFLMKGALYDYFTTDNDILQSFEDNTINKVKATANILGNGVSATLQSDNKAKAEVEFGAELKKPIDASSSRETTLIEIRIQGIENEFAEKK